MMVVMCEVLNLVFWSLQKRYTMPTNLPASCLGSHVLFDGHRQVQTPLPPGHLQNHP
jgi:hypothetical protein